jgi:hypothetical protein
MQTGILSVFGRLEWKFALGHRLINRIQIRVAASLTSAR